MTRQATSRRILCPPRRFREQHGQLDVRWALAALGGAPGLAQLVPWASSAPWFAYRAAMTNLTWRIRVMRRIWDLREYQILRMTLFFQDLFERVVPGGARGTAGSHRVCGACGNASARGAAGDSGRGGTSGVTRRRGGTSGVTRRRGRNPGPGRGGDV